MGESIANPKAMKASQVLGRFSECYRRLEEAGLTFTDLQYPIDDPEFRDRLVEFWKNRGELTLPKPASNWQEQDGVIYFSVTSDGTTGLQWIKRLEGNGFHLGNYAKKVLRSSDFKPTNGMTTEVVVLKGMLFEDNDRITKKIRAEADKRKLSKPNAELACLIREKFRDKEIEAMGLWYIVTMHEPINDSDGDPDLLLANRYGDGRWLNAYNDRPGGRWDRDYGFAFAVSQVS